MKNKLTGKQRAVLSLVAAGKSNHEIAEMMELSKRTIDAHVRDAMKRLGAPDRTAAVVLALHAQEISMPIIVEALRAARPTAPPAPVPPPVLTTD